MAADALVVRQQAVSIQNTIQYLLCWTSEMKNELILKYVWALKQ